MELYLKRLHPDSNLTEKSTKSLKFLVKSHFLENYVQPLIYSLTFVYTLAI